MESHRKLKSGALDSDNAAFWKTLENTAWKAQRLLIKAAQEHGISLQEFEAATQEYAERERTRVRKGDTPLTADAYRYMMESKAFLDRAQETFEKKGDELLSLAAADIPGTRPESTAARISDAREVIAWYFAFINVKLVRASKVLEFDNDDEEFRDEEFERLDSDLSAKLALIAIDRSIQAWAVLRPEFPDEEESILRVLVLLSRLRRETERQFPNAREFKRIAFDD
ncbi:MAG TPA: hypothetical protein VEJ63_10760 [Planctomycetota bacterium]|nr:hypothetical protein [Planctomycetota bacterium]